MTLCPKTKTENLLMGDWVVVVQSLLNVIIFMLLPFMTRLGVLGRRGE